jgi:hypothetical protein
MGLYPHNELLFLRGVRAHLIYPGGKVTDLGHLLRDGPCVAMRVYGSIPPQEGIHKLASHWEERFMVKEATRPTSYRLCDLDGNDIPNSWHIDLLRRFYA